ncbi:MAG: beta-N-acetylhexosaminidase [Bacteroidales bacterium]|nr:beta-N-acetylhexosaminidase [Bacteroidales bacterium]
MKSLVFFLLSFLIVPFPNHYEELGGFCKSNVVKVRECPGMGHEEYTIDVRARRTVVRAGSDIAAFYAEQTLIQLREENGGRTPRVHIEDSPRFAHRGIHLDCSRHFFSIDEVHRFIDVMARYKLNRFHWHLTDDHGWRVEIKKYPLLTEVGAWRDGTMIGWDMNSNDGVRYGGFYTQDELRETVEYARQRGIEIIPEIDLPAHMVSALAAYPELGCTGGPYSLMTVWDIAKDVLCAGKESTFEFLEGVLSEICDIFPYEYIHIGGDECPKGRWENCPACQARIAELGLKDDGNATAEQYLQNYVTSRVQAFLETKGKKVIGWDEILEGDLAPGATIMSWRGTEGGIKASAAGFDVIMTPCEYCYLDYCQAADPSKEPINIGHYVPLEKTYLYDPTDGMDEASASHVLGLQGNVWTEFIAEPWHAEYMLLPRALAIAETGWTDPGSKDLVRFSRDVIDNQIPVLESMGYTCCHEIERTAEMATIPILGWHGIAKEKFAEVLPMIKEAGFDCFLQRVADVDDAMLLLDEAEKAGIKVMPGFAAFNESPETYVPMIRNHPALMAYYLKDEPEVWDLEGLGDLVRRVQAMDMSKPCYINLYPNWAWIEDNYVDNINKFADNCPVTFISFDQYPVKEVDGEIVIRDTWYRNLEEIRNLCMERNLPMWAFALLWSHHLGAPSPEAFYPVPTIAQLRLQVFSDLVYGAQAIQYFTVRGAVDATGMKTPLFDVVKEVNAEIKGLSPVFKGCNVDDVWHLGEIPRGTNEMETMPDDAVRKLAVEGRLGAVVSLISNGGHKYLAVVNKDCVSPATLRIKLAHGCGIVAKDATVSPFRSGTLDLAPGDLLLFRL